MQTQEREEHGTQALLEAMASECAIVTVGIPGIEQVVPTHVGLSAALSAEDLAVKVTYLLNNRDLAVRMGREARKHVEREYSVHAFADYLMGLYEKAPSSREAGQVKKNGPVRLLKEFMRIIAP